MKNIIKGEYEVMILSLEEACKEKNAEVSRKMGTLEKNLKGKLKIIESKIKESKTNGNVNV